MHCSIIEHGIRSMSFQTAVKKDKVKLSSFVQFENEMASYHALQLNKAQLPVCFNCFRT